MGSRVEMKVNVRRAEPAERRSGPPWRRSVWRSRCAYATIAPATISRETSSSPQIASNSGVPQPWLSQCLSISRSASSRYSSTRRTSVVAHSMLVRVTEVRSRCFARSTKSRTRKYWPVSSSLSSQCIVIVSLRTTTTFWIGLSVPHCGVITLAKFVGVNVVLVLVLVNHLGDSSVARTVQSAEPRFVSAFFLPRRRRRGQRRSDACAKKCRDDSTQQARLPAPRWRIEVWELRRLTSLESATRISGGSRSIVSCRSSTGLDRAWK